MRCGCHARQQWVNSNKKGIAAPLAATQWPDAAAAVCCYATVPLFSSQSLPPTLSSPSPLLCHHVPRKSINTEATRRQAGRAEMERDLGWGHSTARVDTPKLNQADSSPSHFWRADSSESEMDGNDEEGSLLLFFT